MESNRTIMMTSEDVEKLPVLIIDKKGFVGSSLAKKLQTQFLVVSVSSRPSVSNDEEAAADNIVYIPYRKKIPLIPDNAYSHIFVVFDGERPVLDMLPSLIKKVNDTNAKIFFITSITQMNHKVFTELSNHLFHNMQVIVYGETFDNSITEANQLNFFIHQARTYGRIEVPNAGLGVVYPVLFDDVISAIIETAFSPEKRKRIVLVFPHHPNTEISIARMLQQHEPMLKLDFKKQRNSKESFYIPPEGQYFFHNYDLEDKLRVITLARKTSATQVPQKKIKLVMPKQRRLNGAFLVAIGAFLFFAILPPVCAVFLALVGAGSLNISLQKLEKGQLASAENYASFARASFSAANNISEGLILIDIAAHDKKELLVAKTQFGKDVTETEIEVVKALRTLQSIFSGKSLDPKNDFLHSTATIKNALLSIQKMRAEDQLPSSAVKKLDEIKYEISLFENLIDALPALLGFEGKRSYLVLFQNNMELRPGGGFIGSYGVIGIENGKLDAFKIYDVYDADGKLKTHVEPPYGLRRYLGSVHWFLRDSNYEIDFTRNAANAQRFLQMEMGQNVDGVIAIDTEFLKSILSAFGSVRVEDYKETVTPENFYLLTQTHAEKNFFPGSTQKKDFLRSLADALLFKLSEGKAEPYRDLIKKTGLALREKHILFSFSDPAIQDIFTVSKLSSSLWEGRSGGEGVFLDAFGVVDANVGANKTNYYLKRSIDQRVAVEEDGSISQTATTTYENTSKKDSPFGGDYKNYVRFILPKDAILQSVIVDNKEIPVVPAVTDPQIYTKPDFVPPPELEIEDVAGEAKKTIGFFVIVPIESRKSVSITYTIPSAVSLENPSFIYDLLVIKQPGTLADPYTLTLSYPSVFQFVKGNSEVRDLGGKVVYEKLLSEDRNVRIEFSKK